MGTYLDLAERAQKIANETKSVRWLNYTSMGWRIEYEPLNVERQSDRLSVAFHPES